MSDPAEREKRALALFEEACDLDEADLAAFLVEACGKDEELRDRVEALLRADRSSADLDAASRSAVARAEMDMAGGGEPQGFPAVPGYEILEELDRGGAGVVYRARDEALNRIVALKMLRRLAEPSQRERFLREAEMVARLQHPNIVQIHEVGEHEGRPYLALEFLEGGTLARSVAGLPQGPRRAAALVETLARTVHHAHQNGVIHRDLKPANVLLAEDGAPKIADFGVARHLDAEQGATRTGTILGTPAYMAPEQAKGQNRRIGPWTDVYALGVILYELLTGFPPFSSDSTLETVRRVAEEDPRPPRRASPDVPRDLETICLKAMAKEPGRRYRSAAALADDLRRFLDLRSIEARRPGPLHRMGLWCRRQPALAGTILAAVVLIALVTGVSFRNVLHERDLAREATYRSLVGEARALIRAGEADWWPEAMERLSQAAALDVPERDLADLRSLAAEGMAVGEPFFLQEERTGVVEAVSMAVPRSGEFVVIGETEGAFSIWSLPGLNRRVRVGGNRPDKVWVAVSADGRRIAAASESGWVRGWSRGGPRPAPLGPPMPLPGGEAPTALALAPDGRRLMVGTDEGGVWLAEMPDPDRSWTELGLVARHADTVKSVAFSPDGDLAASGGSDRLIRLYDAGTGKTLLSRNTSDPVSLVAFDEGGKLLFVSPANHGFGWFAPKEWERQEILQGLHANFVTFVAREEGGRIVSASADGTVRLWSGDGAQMLATTRGRFGPVRVAALASGGRIVAGHADGSLRLWRLEEHRFRLALPQGGTAAFLPGTNRLFLNPGSVHDLAHPLKISGSTLYHPAAVRYLSPYTDGRRIALWRNNDVRETWDLKDRLRLQESQVKLPYSDVFKYAEIEDGGQAKILVGGLLVIERKGMALETHELEEGASCLASAPGLLAAGWESGEVRVWSLPGFQEKVRIRVPMKVEWLELLPHHDLIAIGLGSRETTLWSLDNPSRQVSVAGAGDFCGAMSSDGSKLYLGTRGGAVRAVPLARAADLLHGEEAARGPVRMDVFDAPVPGAHIGATWGVAVSPDGLHLATTGHDGALKIWRTDRPGEILDLEGHDGVSWGVAFSQDGRWLASGAARPDPERGEIILRRAPGWEIEATLEGHDLLVTALAFLPGRDTLVSGSLDRKAMLWSLDDPGAGPRLLHRFEETVTSLTVDPEGRYLVATGPTSIIDVWRLDRFPGPPVQIEPPPGRPWAAAFSDDGRYLAVATEQGAIGLYDGATLEPLVTLGGSQSRFRSLTFSHDNEMLAAGAWVSPGAVWHLGDVRAALAGAGLDWPGS